MKTKIIAKLSENKEYRNAFVAAQINIGIPFQIRALREQRGWSQKDLGKLTGMKQPRISAMERPGGSSFNIETLERLASAFDIALIIRFAPFKDLVKWTENFSPDTFFVPSFDDEKFDLESKNSTAASGKPAIYLVHSVDKWDIKEAQTVAEVGVNPSYIVETNMSMYSSVTLRTATITG